MPGWWFLASKDTPTARVINRQKRITFSLRVHGVQDHMHEDCPHCMSTREWTPEGVLLGNPLGPLYSHYADAKKHLIPFCATVPKIKLAGVGEMRVTFLVVTDRVDRPGGPIKPVQEPSA